MKKKVLISVAVPLALLVATAVYAVRSLQNAFNDFALEPEEWDDYDER